MQPEVRNLPAPPSTGQFIDLKTGALTVLGHRFLQLLWERTGGSNGSTIYDTIDLSQTTSASEAQLFAIRQELESQLQGIVLQVIEQVREQQFDPSGLLTNISEGGFFQQVIDNVLVNTDHIDFSTSPLVGGQTARLLWNDTDGTLDLGLKGGNVTLQLGQEVVLRGLNKTGSTITNAQVVYVSGAQGNRTTVALADADLVSAHNTIGLTTEDILDNQEGFVTTLGLVRDIDTSAWAEGDRLFLSTTAGALTNVEPAAPAHRVAIGYVVRSHATNGSIFVSVQVGKDLSELDDVLITGVANNDALVYDSGTGLWKNRTSTGTGSNVLATSPTLVTPAIGAATGTSIDLTSTATASAFIPTGTSIPANGLFLLAANQTALASNSTTFMSSSSTVTSFPLDIALTKASLTTVYRGDTTGYLGLSGGSSATDGMNLILGGTTTSSFANMMVFRTGSTELMRLTSTGLGLGMTAVNVFDITKNQNATSAVRLLNNDTGSAADGRFILSNGTNTAAALILRGSSNITDPNSLTISSGGAYPLHIFTNGTKRTTVDSTGQLLQYTNSLVMPKTSGLGFKVDTTTPTFPYRDITGPLVARGTGATDPTWNVLRNGIRAYQFSVGDEIWVTLHLDHDYVPGTDVFIHTHYTHSSALVTGGTVTWGFESTVAKGHQQGANSVFGATKTTTVTQTINPTTQYQHFIAETAISSTGGSATLLDNALFEPDSLLLIRVYLSANAITVSSGTAPEPFLLAADGHYQSTGIGTKAKAPNFYT